MIALYICIMTAIIIREIEASDNKELAQIIRSSLKEFGADRPGTVYYDATTDALYELFREKNSVYYVAEQDGVLLGGVGIFPSNGLPDDTVELVKMYLRPQARGLGLGKRLIEKALQFARQSGFQRVYIETMPELEQAMRVYEKFGFEYLTGPMGQTGHTGCSKWMLKKLA